MNIVIKLVSITFLLAFQSSPSFGQQVEKKKKFHTVEIQVSGVCKMCKKRVEKAALIKGVKMAEWDKVEQKMTVVYKTAKVSEEEIHKAIAKSGHDTDKALAPDEKYQKLPACCKYRDGVKVH